VYSCVRYCNKCLKTALARRSDGFRASEPGEQVPSQDDHPWNPQARTTTETVLREAMQALWRVQAHMLARIVVEIRAADIAVELEL
jgi:hypothetical protein